MPHGGKGRSKRGRRWQLTDVAGWIAREFRYLNGLARTLWSIRKIDPESNDLVCDDFEAAVDRFENNTALVFEDERYSYRQLDALANRFAAWADANSIERGETVALLLPNRAEYIPAWIGLTKVGVTVALINSNLSGAALAYCLSIAGAAHVVTDNDTVAAIDSARAALDHPLTYWIIDTEGDLAHDRRRLDLTAPTLVWARPPRARRAGLKAKDTALYIYTSGTTGMPKAARVTHMRAQLYMRGFAGATRTTAQDRLYCVLPLYHATGGLCAIGAALLNGAAIVLRRKFSATYFWDDIAAHDCTIFAYIGELCRYLVNQETHPKERAHRLRLAFGNGLRSDVWEAFQQRFDVSRILEFYGSTEGNVSMFNFDGRPGAIGRVPQYLKNNFAVKLVKFDVDTEQPIRGEGGLCVLCDVDEPGEAVGLIGASARHDYSGYADRAASREKILRNVVDQGDAWFRTGDLMRQDEDGYFYFVDRIGDTFRWKGENVSTTEVADVISRCPGVAEAIVYGVKIDRLDGRAGMAAITTGQEFDLSTLRDYLARELPSYARPIFVRIQRAIESTGTFKYRKVGLVSDGFDPGKAGEMLFFANPETLSYERITPTIYAQIQRGEFKL
jgi:fatty-acyl-CoA synthase